MTEGVDAGAEPEVTHPAPRGARECPYKAHMRIVSGLFVPEGFRAGGRVQRAHPAYVRMLSGSVVARNFLLRSHRSSE